MRVRSAFAYMAITFYGRRFHAVRLAAGLLTLWFYTDARPTTPALLSNLNLILKVQFCTAISNLKFEISKEG